MSASTLQLECPGCTQRLELDAGFSGGVCRCSTCGTLMTVPDDPALDHPEKLVRPDEPASTRHRRPGRPRRSRPESPVAASPHDTSSSDVSASDSAAGVYTTQSGRVVHIDEAQDIPIARKRKIARVTTYIVFSGVVALIVILCAVVSVYLIGQTINRSRNHAGANAGVVEAFTYSRAINPFTFDKANVLGLPLRRKTAVVIDASSQSAPWLGRVEQALTAGLVNKAGGSQVALLYATEDGQKALLGGLQSVANLSRPQLEALNHDVVPSGEADLGAALREALALQPTHLVLVTSRRLSANRMRALRQALGGHTGLFVDVVAVDRDLVAMQDLAQAFNGRYVFLTSHQLDLWQAAVKP